MSLMNEYISKKFTAKNYEDELLRLISEYNKNLDTYLLVFYTSLEKPVPPSLIMLSQDDYYTIYDLICNKKLKSLHVFLESPGGKAETAKDLADLFHTCSEYLNFVICGEAKSAATILALSGNDISMTKTGSLGPIDAQVTIAGRTVSAFNYKQQIKELKEEASEKKELNLVDLAYLSRIIPGELLQVLNSSDFAKELVKEWLPIFKFKDWQETRTKGKKVTEEYKKKRASEIADFLESKDNWKLHAASIKANDLREKLIINELDQDKKISKIVYRIHAVCRMYCSLTSTFKIYATEDNKIFKQAGSLTKGPISQNSQELNSVKIDIECPKCNKKYKFYGKFKSDPSIDKKMEVENAIRFPKDNRFVCDCGFEFNLIGPRSEIEKKIGKKIL